jgi:hypothetical protein
MLNKCQKDGTNNKVDDDDDYNNTNKNATVNNSHL